MAEDISQSPVTNELQITPHGDPNPAYLSSVVETIAGEDADEETTAWVRDNIRSIREAVKNGRHNTLWYVACGKDGLRTAIAYDTAEELLIDNEETFIGTTQDQLRQAGIHTEVSASSDEAEQTISYNLDGSPRVIREFVRDARLVRPSNFGHQTVDILHIYAPTGADTPLTEEDIYFQTNFGETHPPERYDADFQTQLEEAGINFFNEEGNNKIAVNGIDKELTVNNYELVNEGGFFVFGEQRLAPDYFSPALLEIGGLSEKEIVKRHPYTVMTALYPPKEEVQKMDRCQVSQLVHSHSNSFVSAV